MGKIINEKVELIYDKNGVLNDESYEKELLRLQIELVKLQQWIVNKKLKVVVLFEGRDAAGKGGVIKRIIQVLNPRVVKVVALGMPTEKRKGSGISKGMCLSFRPKEKWYFLTGVGTIVPGLKG